MFPKLIQTRLTANLFILAVAGLIGLITLSNHSASASTETDMVSRWSAEGNANDSAGSNHGVLQSGVTYTAGKAGKAFRFDGNSLVEVANSPTLESSTITAAAWVRSFNSPGVFRYVLAKGLQNCDSSSYGLYTGENGGLTFYVYDGNTYVLSPERGPEFWDGNWHYVAGTYDGENVRLYVDGAEVGTGTPSTVSISYGLSTEQKFYIGAQSDVQAACGLSTGFLGDIDEVKLWNRALSDSEIQADFATDNNDALVADPQSITTDEDTAASITLTATSHEGDALTYSIVTPPAHGALSGAAPFLIYTPVANYNGSDSFVFKVYDGIVESTEAPVTIAINPVNDAPVAINDSYGVAKDTPLTVPASGILSNDSDVDGEALTAVKASGPAHGTVILNANGLFTYTPASGYIGQDSFTYKADDGRGDCDVATVSLTVATKTATTSTLTLSKSTPQYSDRVTFEATVTPSVNIGQVPAQSVTFKVGTQVIGTAPMVLVGTAYKGKLTAPLLEPTPWGSGPTGQMKPFPLGRTVTAVFNDISPLYTVANATKNLMISKEDARASYTGQTFVSTSCSTCTTATVTLSATIKDISATLEANGDTDPGDIRHATVTFLNRDTGAAISPALSVTLPNENDPQTGSVTYNWPVSLAVSDVQTIRVGIMVDPNYYVRNTSADDALVTIAKPITPGFISGGGYLMMANSTGLRAGEAGTANNFSFGVKYKAGSSPVGNFNTVMRSRVSGTVRVYQIKGSTITSVVVSGNKATIKGKGSIYDITNGSSLVDGYATFEVSITDNGEPGSSDTVAITIRDSTNGLWFSSYWNGVKTTEQMLGAGNVRIY